MTRYISEVLLQWIKLEISGLTKSDPGDITLQVGSGSLILNWLWLVISIFINILCLNIDIISTVEGAPEYPENLILKDLTGDRAKLAGVYRRQGDSRVWKYGDFELSFNGEYWFCEYEYDNNDHLHPGKLWCISGDNLDCQKVVGWDYSEDFIWPNTDTLYIKGKYVNNHNVTIIVFMIIFVVKTIRPPSPSLQLAQRLRNFLTRWASTT